MSRLPAFPAAALLLLACADTPIEPADTPEPQFAAVVDHFESKEPVPVFTTFIPCANGGAGEFATVTDAELHVVLKTVVDNRGGIHTAAHFQPIRNWDGIGEDTGDVYQAVGVSRETVNLDGNDGFPLVITSVNNFRWIGPGPGNNLLVHSVFHVTVNANGDVSVIVDHSSAECK